MSVVLHLVSQLDAERAKVDAVRAKFDGLMNAERAKVDSERAKVDAEHAKTGALYEQVRFFLRAACTLRGLLPTLRGGARLCCRTRE